MSDNTAKIIIDASADGVLRAAEQVRKKFSEVGEAGGQAGEKLVISAGKALFRVTALLAVAKGVADAFNQAATNAAKISEKAGGGRLKAELSGQRLGLDSREVGGILNAEGSRSADERTQFLASLAGAKGPGGRPIDGSTALEAASLFNSGTVESDQILEALTKRGRGGLKQFGTAESRRDKLGFVARSELDLQSDLSANERDILGTAGPGGRQERRFQAGEELFNAQNPGIAAVDNAMRSVPLLGGVAGSIEDAFLRATQQTAENTRPRLNTSANGP